MYPKVHSLITIKALRHELPLDAIKLIYKSNVDSDFFMNPTPGQHYSCIDMKTSFDFSQKLENLIIKSFKMSVLQPEQDKKHLIKAMYLTGRLLHNVQDFYSHTNWINMTGPEVRIWNESIETPNITESKNLLKCNFRWLSEFREMGLKHFYKEKLAEQEDYYQKYINGTSLSHFELNKDGPESIADLAYISKYGISGFELAFADARLHTLSKWNTLLIKLKQEIGLGHYSNILHKLQSWKFSESDLLIGREVFQENFEKQPMEAFIYTTFNILFEKP